MSTAARPPLPAAAPPVRWSMPARLMAAFSGTVGLVAKYVLLAIVNALALWALTILITKDRLPAAIVLVLATAAIDLVYLLPHRWTLPLKFLLPGTVFLIVFQLVPIAYTINIAFTNYSTGHILSKDQAIEGVKQNSLAPPPDGRSYIMAPARNEDGELVLLLQDEASGQTYVGTRDGLEDLPRSGVTVSPDGLITRAEGYKIVTGAELFTLESQLANYTIPTEGSSAIRPEGIETALELQPAFRYDEEADAFIATNGTPYADNGNGAFEAANGDELEPGWKTGVGFKNFDSVFTNPAIRKPFLRVFVWTLSFAIAAVVLSFALGLFLAITLDKPGMHLQRFYRTLLVIPYAIPSFLTLLVWAGLLNDDFGVVNRVLHTDIPWLFDGNWAKVSIVLVSVWLTFPYFFLVSLGALQSIPGELVEAARVDGAGPWGVFRRITLPLLLIAVAPLMIASFAFNFNNFNNIYLLTSGGPPADDGSVAGSTDILISYTYKLAFESGKGGDYALAATIAFFIFTIVATISAFMFWQSRTLETVR